MSITASKGRPGRLALFTPWRWALLLATVALLWQMQALHLDQRLYQWLRTSSHAEEWQARSLWLPDYRVQVEARPLAGVTNNLSGLTWDERRDQLWAVVNNPPELLALSRDGELRGRWPLQGFEDVEGIAYLGDNLLVLAEERRGALVVVPVPDQGGALRRGDYPALTLGLQGTDNSGFEGLGYDRGGDRLFVVKEHTPRKLYEIRGLRASLDGRFDLQVIDREAWIRDAVIARDLSSVHFDERSGHLLLLSDESRLVMELNGAGQLVSFRSLQGGFAGLERSVPQAEGMTIDGQGHLYLVSEPNLFYRLSRD
ncbi:SdiA-regulated [compost metagenome]